MGLLSSRSRLLKANAELTGKNANDMYIMSDAGRLGHAPQ